MRNNLKSILGLVSGVLLAGLSTGISATIDPVKTVREMSPGWNLGNAMDGIPNEDSWGNKPTRETTIEDIRKAGFKTIRMPVTWTHHMGPGPDYTIDEKWMNRVEEVVDWGLKRDLYVILDVHHDSWEWMNVMAVDPKTGKYVNDFNTYMPRLEKVWAQIAKRFSQKSGKLIFEILNEPNDGMYTGDTRMKNRRTPSIQPSGTTFHLKRCARSMTAS